MGGEEFGLDWVSTIAIEGGDEGGSWDGGVLCSLHESWEEEEDGEVVKRGTGGGFDFLVRCSCRCASTSGSDTEILQAEQM